jgi:hypothetical protein
LWPWACEPSPELPEFYTDLLDEHGNGDAFVATVQVAVMAEFWTLFDGIAGIFLENTPFFSKNDASHQAFFFAAKQRSAQRPAEGASLPCRAISMDDLDGDDLRFLGLAEFGKEKAAGFIDSGQSGLDIESFESRHGELRELCLSRESNTNR